MSGMKASADDEPIRCRRARRRLSAASSAASAPSTELRLHLPAGEHLLTDSAVGGVVVDDQRAHVAQIDRGRKRGVRQRAVLDIEMRRETRSVLPRSTSLSTQIRPPISSTSWRRDRQAQPGAAVAARRRGVGLHERTEDLRLLAPRGMPMPVSDTAKRQRAPRPRAGSTPTSTDTSPRSVNLMALPTRLISTWRRRPGSPTSASGTSGAMRQASSRPFLCARGASSLYGVSRRCRAARTATCSSVKLAALRSLEKSRMSLIRLEQRFARVLDRPQVVALLGGELGSQRQLGHPDDGVHRRANLVAHVGQKLALGLGRLLGALFRDLELSSRTPPIRHIARHRINQTEIAVPVRRPLKPFVRTVRAPVPILESHELRVVHDRRSRVERGFPVVWMHELEPRLGEELLARNPQRPFPRRD